MHLFAGCIDELNPRIDARSQKQSDFIEIVRLEDVEAKWNDSEICSSFIPGESDLEHRFYRVKIQATDGWVSEGGKNNEELRTNFIFIIKDPIRPYDIQIDETRSLRKTISSATQINHLVKSDCLYAVSFSP